MSDPNYSSREIDEKFGSLRGELLDERFGILPRIERQTTKTNGRVNKLERIVLVIGAVLATLLATQGMSLIGLITHFL